MWSTLPSGMLVFLAMVLRMAILGAYATLLVVTAEVFPTKIRATGVGLCGAVARVAGMITPFVAEAGPADSYVVPLTVYGLTALLAVAIALMLPLETTGLGSARRPGQVALRASCSQLRRGPPHLRGILAAMTEDEPMGGSAGSVYAIDDSGPTDAEDEAMLGK